MPVPSTMADLSPVAADNSPAGSSPVGPDLDNHLRAHAAIIRQFSDDLASSDPDKGAARVNGVTRSVANYASVRTFTGSATRLEVGGRTNYFDGCQGIFIRNGSAVDNDGTVLVDALGRSWERFIPDGVFKAAWFGVTASWNADAQTGNDDTSALQNCINYVMSTPNPRANGKRTIELPAGGIRITSVVIPRSSSGYALLFVGKGDEVTSIWCDQSVSDPGLVVQAEYVRWKNLSIHGALKTPSLASERKAVTIRFKRDDNMPDIDTTFTDCFTADNNVFAEVHGRGFYWNGGSFGSNGVALNIVADADLIFPTSDPDGINDYTRGMRNYAISRARTDGVSVLIDVTGTGNSKDYINTVKVHGCDLSVDRVLRGIDATLVKPSLVGNTSYAGCQDAVVEAKAVVDGRDVANNWNKTVDNATPSSAAQCIQYGWKVTNIDGLTIAATSYGKLYRSLIKSDLAKNVNILGINLPQCWEYMGSDTNKYLLDSTAPIENLVVTGITCSASSYSGNHYITRNAPSGRTDYRVRDVISPWAWVTGTGQVFTPQLYVGASLTAGSVTGLYRYNVSDSNVIVDFSVLATIPETTGDISLTLPITPRAMYSAHSSYYSGAGSVAQCSNIVSTVDVKSAMVEANSNRLKFQVATTTSTTRRYLTAADISSHASSVYIAGTFSYRWSD